MCSCKDGMRNCICIHSAILLLMLDVSIKMPVELEKRCARLRMDRRNKQARKQRDRRAIPAAVPDMSDAEVHPPTHTHTHTRTTHSRTL